MPEGDTILWAATRMRPVLEGRVPELIEMPAGERGERRASAGRKRWPSRLLGRAITRIDTHGKHLFLRFEGGLVLHSHLGMTGMWGVFEADQRWPRSRSRAWLVLGRADRAVIEFDGPVLELMTDGRSRFDQRLAALGPDVLGEQFDRERFIARVREDDPSRPIGDALLDQRNLAGIGNIWKSEGCWEARVDPWRPLRSLSDEQLLQIVSGIRPRMLDSGLKGPRHAAPRVFRRAGRPCGRCGTAIAVRTQGEANRATYWCPHCQC
jgi:endonuclease VIII